MRFKDIIIIQGIWPVSYTHLDVYKRQVHMLPKVSYVGFLTNNLLQTVGIMVDTQKVDKQLLVMPDLRRRQDAATWLQILKAGFECYGVDEILAQYRRAEQSLSSNKSVSYTHL